MRILGIDPGSRKTGYAVVDAQGARLHCVEAGVWRLGDGEMGGRLMKLQDSLDALIQSHKPDMAAVETVFVKSNPNSALKLGQARGVVLCTLAQHAVPMAEYTPTTIKQSILGSGRAEKGQVIWMTRRLLNLKTDLAEDAADAAAAAICHHHHNPMPTLRNRLA